MGLNICLLINLNCSWWFELAEWQWAELWRLERSRCEPKPWTMYTHYTS